jgi:dihydrofolate reductase
MTQLIYYVAATEDGFIAGPQGELDWLHRFETPDEDYGYANFIAGIDGLVMGRATFDVARSFGDWPYGARPTWVLTHREPAAWSSLPAGVRLCQSAPAELMRQWRAMPLQRVWLVGGGEVAAAFAAANLIDELVLTTVPVTLGAGIGLFGANAAALAQFEPVDSVRYPNGLLQRRGTHHHEQQ